MTRHRVAMGCTAVSLVLLALVACRPDSAPPAASQERVPATTASMPASVTTQSSSAPPSPASGATPSSTPPPLASVPQAEPPEPPPIVCKTEDDCWFGDDHKPIGRPAKLRGKKIVPCKTGGHSPACVDGVCKVRAWKC